MWGVCLSLGSQCGWCPPVKGEEKWKEEGAHSGRKAVWPETSAWEEGEMG
jgi:hypothetical protein